jgi:hypothetical protein
VSPNALPRTKPRRIGKPHHKIAVNIPTPIYDKIAKRAKKAKVSFSEMAVKLLDCGLFDYEDSEQYDDHDGDG